MLRLRDSLGEFWACDDGPGWAEFWPNYVNGVWHDHLLGRLREIDWSGRRGVFVDVGAWIGPVTLWAARLGAQVVALEPDPVAYRGLVETIGANDLRLVSPLCAAVTPFNSLAKLAANPTGAYGDSSSRLDDEGMATTGFSLPDLLTLMRVVPEEVALVKVDVEGYERELMPVLGHWLAGNGIPYIVEEHP